MKVRTSLSYNTAPEYYVNKEYSFVGSDFDMWLNGGNCTHYAYARSCELAGHNIKNDKDFTRFPNAGQWYKYTKWKTGTEPKAGAIGECQGHVFIVEEVYPDGSYLISQSSYRDFIFGTAVVNTRVGEVFSNISGKLLHFIYNPYIEEEEVVNSGIITSEDAITKMAEDVINGKYGNGRLTRMANLYSTIQKRVNELMEAK